MELSKKQNPQVHPTQNKDWQANCVAVPTWMAIDIEESEGGREDTSTATETEAVAVSAETPPEGTSGRDRPNVELSFDSTLHINSQTSII